MTEEDKQALAAEIADELQDSCGIETDADRDLTARCIVDRIGHTLRQQGWMPPEKSSRIIGGVISWAARLGKLPEHHINRDVLISHLVELGQILNDR